MKNCGSALTQMWIKYLKTNLRDYLFFLIPHICRGHLMSNISIRSNRSNRCGEMLNLSSAMPRGYMIWITLFCPEILFWCNLRYFVTRYILLQFTLFCHSSLLFVQNFKSGTQSYMFSFFSAPIVLLIKEFLNNFLRCGSRGEW